jgi:mono/diheme cytochrome c family protein
MYHRGGQRRSFMRLLGIIALVSTVAVVPALHAADVQNGKAVAQAKCIECHSADDWEGEDAKSLESLIRDIVGGKVKHKRKLELTSAEMADIAVYWAAASNAKSR